MLRTLALTILITFSANAAYALNSKDIVSKGTVIASGSAEDEVKMVVLYKGNLYNCDAYYRRINCTLVDDLDVDLN